MKYLFTLLMATAIVVANAQVDTAALKIKAWELYDETECTEAIIVVDRVLSEDSNRADMYMLRGICQLTVGEFEEGMNDLSHAIALEPHDPYYWKMRSLMHSIMLEFDAALQDMIAANKTLPPYTKGSKSRDSLYTTMYGLLGACYSDVREFDSAMAYYNKVLAIDSNNEMAVHSAIITYIEQKEYKKAHSFLKKYEQIAGESLEPAIMYVWYYVSVGEYKKAIKLSEELLRIEKTPYGELLSNKAYAHYKLGELDQALEDINRSIDRNPSNSYAYKNRALIYIAKGKPTDACNDLRAALDMGYTTKFGTEVEELYVEHCNKM